MKGFLALLPLALIHLSAAAAFAEPYTLKPNGDLLVNTTFTSTGVFACSVPETGCTGSGTGSITFTSGASALTLTFVSEENTIQVSNTARRVTVGYIKTELSGPGPFTFPTRTNDQFDVVKLTFGLMTSSPKTARVAKLWGFGPGGGSSLALFDGRGNTFDYSFFLPQPLPNNLGYTMNVFTLRPFPIEATPGIRPIEADVGIVPEPGTMLLVGSGVAGVLAAARRRSRQPL